MRAASDRVAALRKQLDDALPSWSMAPVVRSLVALRGVDRITAMTLLSELGDVCRFDAPRQLMAYLGLVPSGHSVCNTHGSAPATTVPRQERFQSNPDGA